MSFAEQLAARAAKKQNEGVISSDNLSTSLSSSTTSATGQRRNKSNKIPTPTSSSAIAASVAAPLAASISSQQQHQSLVNNQQSSSSSKPTKPMSFGSAIKAKQKSKRSKKIRPTTCNEEEGDDEDDNSESNESGYDQQRHPTENESSEELGRRSSLKSRVKFSPAKTAHPEKGMNQHKHNHGSSSPAAPNPRTTPKAERILKSKNRKLRLESLLLKAQLERRSMEQSAADDSMSDDDLEEVREENVHAQQLLKSKNKQLRLESLLLKAQLERQSSLEYRSEDGDGDDDDGDGDNSDDDSDDDLEDGEGAKASGTSGSANALGSKLSGLGENASANTAAAVAKGANLSEENVRLQRSMMELQHRYNMLELQLIRDGESTTTTMILPEEEGTAGADDDDDDDRGKNFSGVDEKDKASSSSSSENGRGRNKHPARVGRNGGKGGKGKGKGKGVVGGVGEKLAMDLSNRSEAMSHDELSKENARLTQLLLDIGELEELEKIRTNQDDEIDAGEKDVAILQLQQKLAETESELVEVTELKNAEIDVLRKQLNRAEISRTRDAAQDANATVVTDDEREERWKKEREGLREEIRRLNVEVSSLKERYHHHGEGGDLTEEEEEEELSLIGRYVNSNNGNAVGNNAVPRYSAQSLEDSDVASLQSIIAMMRQTIDQSNREKDLLEQRLSAEQDRSQMELHAFARTLEGVDDLRKSAEVMGREIRRIKVRGYRPTRSDLLGGGGGILMMNDADGGSRNFGELTAAVEASDNMEEAIRLIESQNDAMEERRRMGVVARRAVASTTASTSSTKKESGTSSWGALGVSDADREGGFLSFWNNANSRNGRLDDEREDEGYNANGGTSKEKKKKSKRKHKRRDNGGGSVLTSFF